MLILASALMLNPRLLLVDEISEGLQPSIIERIAGVLRDEIRREGVGVLLVEQNLDFALSAAQRWGVFERGEIRDEGLSDQDARGRVLAQLSP